MKFSPKEQPILPEYGTRAWKVLKLLCKERHPMTIDDIASKSKTGMVAKTVFALRKKGWDIETGGNRYRISENHRALFFEIKGVEIFGFYLKTI